MEALVIGRELREGAHVLNQKQEYNRCLLPELLVKDTKPTTNLEGPISGDTQRDTLGNYSLGNTNKRDTKMAGTRPRIVRRKRRKIDNPINRRTEPDRTSERYNREEQNHAENHPSEPQKCENKKRKTPEESEGSKQNSTQENSKKRATLQAFIKGQEPAQPGDQPKHIPSTTKANQTPKNQKHKGNLNNLHIGTIIKGKRRNKAPRDSKTNNLNNDIRSYFKSIGDRLRNRETQHTEVQVESERSPGQQELPGDLDGMEPSKNSL